MISQKPTIMSEEKDHQLLQAVSNQTQIIVKKMVEFDKLLTENNNKLSILSRDVQELKDVVSCDDVVVGNGGGSNKKVSRKWLDREFYNHIKADGTFQTFKREVETGVVFDKQFTVVSSKFEKYGKWAFRVVVLIAAILLLAQSFTTGKLFTFL